MIKKKRKRRKRIRIKKIKPKVEEYGFTRYYNRGKKALGAVEDYSQTRYMSNIIQFCRLRPYELVLNSNNWMSRINDLYKKWVDCYGCSINFVNPHYKFGDIAYSYIYDVKCLKLNMNGTDLYNGITIDKIIKISQSLLFANIEEETFGNYQIVCLYGIDKLTRSFININGYWEKCSSLLFGSKLLRQFKRLNSVKNFFEIKLKNLDIALPYDKGNFYIGEYEPNFVEFLNNNYNNVLLFK